MSLMFTCNLLFVDLKRSKQSNSLNQTTRIQFSKHSHSFVNLQFIFVFICEYILTISHSLETPFGRVSRRSRYKQQQPTESSSIFSEKDEELAEKIRTYRENMRKRTKKPSGDEEFIFRRENVFDFEAWYKAHFNDDFDTKLRNERIKQYAEQYNEQKMRILRGEFRIRPPRPYLERKPQSDIEYQMEEMTRNDMRKEIQNTLLLGIIVMFCFCAILIIMEKEKSKGPYEDLYAKKQKTPPDEND